MPEKMRAAWWWIDRWRKSTAYTDMTLAEQGAYRNLLDELWLRGGALPNDERILAKICGDPWGWKKVRENVLARFSLTPEGWRNETHDEVSAQSNAFHERQREKGRRRAATATRGQAGTFVPLQPDNQPDNQPDASREPTQEASRATSLPSPSPSPNPSQTKEKNNTLSPTASADMPANTPEPPAGNGHDDEYSEPFLTFWHEYPRKVGKGAAWREWKKAKGDTRLNEILAGIARWRTSSLWIRDGGQFIAHPRTWLSQRRWQDEPERASRLERTGADMDASAKEFLGRVFGEEAVDG